MKFSDIKNDIISPKNHKIIDKRVLVEGKFFHVISAYKELCNVKIIALNVGDTKNDDSLKANFGGVKTKRDEMMLLYNCQSDEHISVKKIYLDENEITLCRISSDAFLRNYTNYFMLSYILGLGLDLEYLDDILLSNIMVSTYEIEGITLDLNNAKTLKITRYPSVETVLANIDFNFTKNKKTYCFKDKDNIEHKFKAGLTVVDIWNDVVPKQQRNYNELFEKLNEKEKELQGINGFDTTIYESVCPKDKNLLCVVYESETQLDFYTKEYLNSEIEKNNQKGAFMFLKDKENNERLCILGTIEGFEVESIEVELFSWKKNTEHDDIVVAL